MEIINREYGNIEGFVADPEVWSRTKDEFEKLSGESLGAARVRIGDKTEELILDIKELATKLNQEKMELQGILETYNKNKENPETNFDKAAEPLKDETLKFSNYSYVPLAYYPIGCLFLLFLIYKKL